MTVSKWMHVGTTLKMNAINFPDKLGCQDKNKKLVTFKEWNERSCRLANALDKTGRGIPGSLRHSRLQRLEWMEIYASCAKGGQVMVPIMFRLAPPEMEYIVNHSESKAFIVEEPFVEIVNAHPRKLPTIPKG